MFSPITLLILSVPFLHAFGFFGLSFPLIIGIATLVIFSVLRRFRIKVHYLWTDIFLILPIFIGLITIDYADLMPANILHLCLWIATLAIFYFGTKTILVCSDVSVAKLKYVFFWALIITSVGVTADFYLANFLGYYLTDILPYNVGTLDATKNFSGSLFRVRGFAAEPGFTAMVYEFLLPLGILGCVGRPMAKILMAWMIACYLILTSAASLAGFLVCVSVAFLVLNFRKVVAVGVPLVALAFIFFDYIQQYLYEAIAPKIEIWASGDSIRYQIYESLVSVIAENPMGIGIGSLSSAFERVGHYHGIELMGGGAISLYFEIAVYSGILGIASFFIFLAVQAVHYFSLHKTPELLALGFSFVWLACHHALLTEYYFPMLWINLAILSCWKYVALEPSAAEDKNLHRRSDIKNVSKEYIDAKSGKELVD